MCSEGNQKEAMACWHMFVNSSGPYRDETPKSHLMVHLIRKAVFMGNPWRYTTFEDEAQNKTLRKITRLCHQANFETMCFLKLEAYLERSERKRKR